VATVLLVGPTLAEDRVESSIESGGRISTTLQLVAWLAFADGAVSSPGPPEDWPLADAQRGWLVRGRLRPLAFDALESAGREVSGGSSRAIVAAVQSSDFAYLAAIDDGEVTARAVINRRLAEDFQEGLAALQACRELYGTDEWEPLATASLSSWREPIQARRGPGDLERILAREWVDALEGMDHLLEAVGVPPSGSLTTEPVFGEARYVDDSGGGSIRGVGLRFEDQPFVMGVGEGFLGVWDRAHPATPAARFPSTPDGRRAREAFFITHCFPVQSPEFGESWKVESSGPFPTQTDRSRLTSLDDERFLLGWGVDFIGIWDREHPDAPVARFPDTEEGNLAAWEAWLRIRVT
jgi:hypothetical protein